MFIHMKCSFLISLQQVFTDGMEMKHLILKNYFIKSKSSRQGLHTGHGNGPSPCRGCWRSYFNVAMEEGSSALHATWFNSGPTFGAKTVTVGDLPTAPDTLGNYQPLNWAMLAQEHTGVITTERSHIYHLNTTYLLRYHIRVHHSTWYGITRHHLHNISTSDIRTSKQIFITEHQYRTEP